MSVVAVIPARYASTRFPGKPLAMIGEKPMIRWVYERVQRASRVDRVIVATDDERILEAVRAFGGEAVMTSGEHPSGTDRIAEAALGLDAEIIVNVQGDEPLIRGDVIDACIRPLQEGAQEPVVTPCVRIRSLQDLRNPDVVKVVKSPAGRALYFSRFPIPFDRGRKIDEDCLSELSFWKHLGLYAYRRDFLLQYSRMAPSPLEKREKLEQLRILENGYTIRVEETDYDSVGVDSPEDLEKIRDLFYEKVKEKPTPEDTIKELKALRNNLTLQDLSVKEMIAKRRK
ncbi:MAG: 3-deoxy-manno-octulosonate cytidylyltransferase [Deltaproteobacteria bacterium]|nr:3-deoxy-manno-octulosonate cytidylyltransferase [Deltaproteobacteria bacterium]